MIFTCAPKKACIYNLHCITTVSLSHKPWQQRWLASNTQQGQHLLHRAATEASTSSLVTRWEWSAAGCTIEKKELFKLASGPRIPSAHSWAFEDSVMLQLLGGQSPEQPVRSHGQAYFELGAGLWHPEVPCKLHYLMTVASKPTSCAFGHYCSYSLMLKKWKTVIKCYTRSALL